MSKTAQPNAAGQSSGTPATTAISETLRAVADDLREVAQNINHDLDTGEFWYNVFEDLVARVEPLRRPGSGDIDTYRDIVDRVIVTASKVRFDIGSMLDGAGQSANAMQEAAGRLEALCEEVTA